MNFIKSKSNLDFLEDFCKTTGIDSNHSTQALWNFLKEPKASRMLDLFGYINFQRICMELNPQPYQEFKSYYKQTLHDFRLTLLYNASALRHNLGSSKEGVSFKPVGKEDTKNYLQSEKELVKAYTGSIEGFAEKNCIKFLSSCEMPRETAKALDLYSLTKLQVMFREKEKANEIMKALLFSLKPESKINLESFPISRGRNFIPFQRMLLQSSAVVDENRFSSWMEELFDWGKYYPEAVKPIIRLFKVYRCVGLMERAPFREIFLKKDTPPLPYPFDQSFHHFLIKKTMDQITSIWPLSDTLYKMLAELFIKSDKERQVFCFYLYILRQFLSDASSCPLKRILSIEKPTKPPLIQGLDAPIIQALHILDRVTNNSNDITKKILTLITILKNVESHHHLDKVSKADLLQLFYLLPPQVREVFEIVPFLYEHPILKIAAKTPQTCEIYRQLLEIFKSYFFSPEGDPFDEMEKAIASLRELDQEAYQAFKQFIDFLHFAFYVEVTPQNGSLLIQTLAEFSDEEKKTYHHELLKYGQSLEIFYKKDAKKGKYLHRRTFFREVYMRFHQWLSEEIERLTTKKEKLLAENLEKTLVITTKVRGEINQLLHEWPRSFLHFNFNFKLIEIFKNLLPFKLPIDLVTNVFLYPVFLSSSLCLIEKAIQLKKELFQWKNFLFIPSALVNIIDAEIVSSVQDAENIISTSHLPGDHPYHMIKYFFSLANFFQLALIPQPTYTFPIKMGALKLFPDYLHPKFLRIQHTFHHLAEQMTQGIAYVTNWDNSERFPFLELTFIRSTKTCESYQTRIPLMIESAELKRDEKLWDLMKKMITILSGECSEGVSQEIYEKELSLQEELELCKELFPPVKATLSKFFKVNQNKSEPIPSKGEPEPIFQQEELSNPIDREKIYAILTFIKQLKIFTREALYRLTSMPEEDEILLEESISTSDKGKEKEPKYKESSLIKVAKKGHIYAHPEALSLVPQEMLSFDTENSFHLPHTFLKENFSLLCTLLKEGTENRDIPEFCEMMVNGKPYMVSAFYKRHNFSLEKVTHKFRRFYDEITFVINTTPPCQFSLTFRENTKKEKKNYLNTSFSRLVGFANDAEIENILRWSFLSTLAKYYQKLEI